ncbi:MAG: SDR family oxidoreductase, partial [Chloroflexota bacterium]
MSKKILVVGATGNIGRTLVNLLAEKGESVKAATRHPETYQAHANVEAVAFDYDQPESYGPALAKADRLFLLPKAGDPEADKTLIALIERAKQEGWVGHIVLLTAMGVDQADENLGLRRAELHLINSGIAYTILRPNWFIQNFAGGFILPSIKAMGGIYLPAGDAKTSFIDTRDIAAVAAEAFTDDRHWNKEYTLTGGEALSYQEAAAIVSEVAGRTIPYASISEDDARVGLSRMGWPAVQIDFMLQLFGAVRQGWTAAISPVVAEILGEEAKTLK